MIDYIFTKTFIVTMFVISLSSEEKKHILLPFNREKCKIYGNSEILIMY